MSAWCLLTINSNLIKFPVPVVGMLCGNSISAVVVSINYVLKEFVCVSGTTMAVTLSTGY